MAPSVREEIEVHKEELLSLFRDKAMSMPMISRHLEEKHNVIAK